MVCERCKMSVKTELRNLGLHFIVVELGEADIIEELSDEQSDHLNTGLKKNGLELINDKKKILVEKIKTIIVTIQ